MTSQTPTRVEIEWEPVAEGILLGLNSPVYGTWSGRLPMMSVRELRDDMADADMLASGYEKIENVEPDEVQPGDAVFLFGRKVRIVNILKDRTHFVLQSSNDEVEVRVLPDELLDVYRVIS